VVQTSNMIKDFLFTYYTIHAQVCILQSKLCILYSRMYRNYHLHCHKPWQTMLSPAHQQY